MKILLLRHAMAEDRLEWNRVGKPDELRPLSKKGILRFCDAVEGLSRLVPKIDHIFTSPLTRTVQTTELLANRYHNAEISTQNNLAPSHDLAPFSELFYEMDDKYGEQGVICLVGHQPDLGELASLLLTRKPESLIRLKKGGAAYFSYRQEQTQLQWLLTQRHLAFIGKAD